MPRFFVEEEPRGEYFLGGEDGRHAALSLRMRPGENVTLCFEGREFFCKVARREEQGLWLNVEKSGACASEPHVKATVCQCWPKGDKLDTVVQKSVELGAWELRPVESARCVSRPSAQAAEKKLRRLRKIAKEAAQQSGRGAVPQVLPPLSLKEALEDAAGQGEIFFFYEQGRGSLKQALGACGERIFLFIGPEGGFSPEEAELAKSLGGKILTLGPRILRTETAPLAALSAIFYEKGDMEL